MKTLEEIITAIKQKLADLESAESYANRRWREATTDKEREEMHQFSQRNLVVRLALEEILGEGETND